MKRGRWQCATSAADSIDYPCLIFDNLGQQGKRHPQGETMAAAMRVTGAWVQLLTDWLDRENLP
ncbi:hypothetical protein, partial [Alcanivorax sp. HI0083]|uniref:hypothetical protein n=1 Tax=Alcanivorax sp. HI0083 TaxID=1822258 RepID=UPI001E38A865